jgi:hypothetical protein
MPAFETYPFGSPMRGGCGRFPSGALRRLSSSEGYHYATVPLFCKEESAKSFSQKGSGGSHRVAASFALAPLEAPHAVCVTAMLVTAIHAAMPQHSQRALIANVVGLS